jgi:hypothetical protein
MQFSNHSKEASMFKKQLKRTSRIVRDGMSRRTAAMLAIVVVAMAAAAGLAAPAQALTTQKTGCPGAVQAPVTTNGGLGGVSFAFPQRYAWRSACYSALTQVISIRYRMWGLNLVTRQWVYYTAATTSTAVAPGQIAVFSAWSAPSFYANVSVDVLVEWRLTNGTLIGSTYINYDSVTDYACLGSSTCRVYSDPVVGAYLHLV